MSDEGSLGYEPGSFDRDDYVAIAHARDEDQAERFVALLGDHDIPAYTDEESHEGPDPEDGISIFVPPDFAEEAEEIINDHEQTGEFEIEDDELDSHAEDEDPDAAILDVNSIGLDDTTAGTVADVSLLDEDDLGL